VHCGGKSGNVCWRTPNRYEREGSADSRAAILILDGRLPFTPPRHGRRRPATHEFLALGQIRDVVNATIGFDALAARTGVRKTGLMCS
jgi:hypothetical protein